MGFLVSPHIRTRVGGFLQYNERLVSIQLKAKRERLNIISAYAPHNGLPYDVRVKFYHDLSLLHRQCSVGRTRVFTFGDFNARIGSQGIGEGTVFGPHSFGNQVSRTADVSNRELLLEYCLGHEICVSNTFAETPASQKVTFFTPGTHPFAPIDERKFALLDLVLCRLTELVNVQGVQSVRTAALATDHFLVICQIRCELEPRVSKRKPKADLDALHYPADRQCFVQTFQQSYQCMSESRSESLGTDTRVSTTTAWACMADALHTAEEALPKRHIQARKKWISQRTLDLISQRTCARQANNYDLERTLQRRVRQSVRRDKIDWIDSVIADGSWDQLRTAFKAKAPAQGRLCDSNGHFVSSERRADTLADFFEHSQWGPRASDIPASGSHAVLDINMDAFSVEEVREVLISLKRKKAAGPNGVCAEHLKALLSSREALRIFTDFLNECWSSESIPDQWHLAHVAAIFKKGSVALPANYRPISLLDMGYKVFASLLRRRLIEGGAEERLSTTQFGFRSGCSTQDAIFLLRRRVEIAHAQRNGRLLVLALDWAKAFDSLEPKAMIAALGRFGVPPKFLSVISAIYSDRSFKVVDNGVTSSARAQQSGISQGCPLSPFLFVMVMSVIMREAAAEMSSDHQQRLADGRLGELLYADDTLLLSVSSASLSSFMASISACGNKHGLELHWGKLQLMKVRCGENVRKPDGSIVEATDEMVYLGASICNDGRLGRELSRRLGFATREFNNLLRVWKHCRLSQKRKIEIFNSLVVSKLTYGLVTSWLSTAERRRVDGFQNRCLRTTMNITPAYVSRVSNKDVLTQAQQTPVSARVLEQQLLLFGKVSRLPDGNPMRDATFCPGSLRSSCDRYVRRVGRPRLEWASELYKHAIAATGSEPRMRELMSDAKTWRHYVCAYVYSQ